MWQLLSQEIFLLASYPELWVSIPSHGLSKVPALISPTKPGAVRAESCSTCHITPSGSAANPNMSVIIVDYATYSFHILVVNLRKNVFCRLNIIYFNMF